MPPKRTVEDIVEALLDTRLVEALGKALGATICKIVETRLDEKLESLLDTVTTLKADNARTMKAVADLSRENKALKTRMEELDAYSRSDNLIIHGLPESSYSEAASAQPPPSQPSSSIGGSREPNDSASPLETNVASEKVIIDFVNNKLHVPLSPADISVAHRLTKKPGDLRPAPIIVRFTNKRMRNAVYSARKVLFKTGFFINEQLTKDRAALLKEAKQLVKGKKLHGAWTNNGVVYIKISDLPNTRPIRVDHLGDLPRG